MKIACCWVFVLCAALCGQTNGPTQSKDWLDLSGKTDEAIVIILEQEVARLAETSEANEANARVEELLAQEKAARQAFEQKSLLLESELTAAIASREAAEKTLADLRTDSTALASQAELYARSEQRLRERLGKFPFKAVVLAKAAYTGNLEPVKEKMIYEAGRLAIEQINGVQIISETLVKNGIVVRDVIRSDTEGKADCQPREWKELAGGTQRILYLYGIYEIYPLAEGMKLSGTAARLPLLVETHYIKTAGDATLANLPANVQQEIAAMVSTAEQEDSNTRANLSTLVQTEKQLLLSSGITTDKVGVQTTLAALKTQIVSLSAGMSAKRQAEATARQKFEAHRNSEQRIEIATQSDLERNRSEALVKAKLMGECVTQFRTVVKSLYSQEKSNVENFMLVESTRQSMMKKVRLQAAKVLGVLLTSVEGEVKYTASVAFRFGFDYGPAVPEAPSGMVYIPPDSFMMGSNLGSNNEKPIHAVYVDAFYMDKREVTVGQFEKFIRDTGYKTDAERAGSIRIWNGSAWVEVKGVDWRYDVERKKIPFERKDHPVIHVSWNDAHAYAKWSGKRLPTEAEWEYAAQSGDHAYTYAWGDQNPAANKGDNIADESLRRKLNWRETFQGYDDGYVFTSPVGSFAPNEFGLYDMSGNVGEWCSDWYGADYYQTSPTKNPRGPSNGELKVVRGGAWSNNLQGVRCSIRGGAPPTFCSYNIGFRCVLDAR